MKELDRFRELLRYEPETGKFYWRVNRRGSKAKAGLEAGCIDNEGYRAIRVDDHQYRAARVSWLFVNGEWPKKYIDHINHNRDDNRIANLRDVSDITNNRNRAQVRDLPCGIYRHGRGYRAQVQANRKIHRSRTMPNVTMALLWLAALRAEYDPLGVA